MSRKQQLKSEIATTSEQIRLLDNNISTLKEKHEKIKLDPFGTRKGKVLREIESKETERELLQKKLDDMNKEYSEILKEEKRIKENKRFFKGDGNKPVIRGVIIATISTVAVLAASLVGVNVYKNHQINMRKIEIGYNSDHIIGMDYEKVAAKLSERGFTNVSPHIMEDIDSYDGVTRVGVITDVSVGGETSFSPVDKFYPETEIVITYHTLTEKAIADREAQIQAEEEARTLAEKEKEEAFRKEEEERERKKAEEKAKAEEERKTKEEAAAKEKAKKEKIEAEKKIAETPVAPPVIAQTNPVPAPNSSTGTENPTADGDVSTVYITEHGERYHQDPNCGGKNSYATTLEDAKRQGKTPCKKCAQ